MNKTEYLIKTFKRAKGKDFENYVINAIWHKLDNMNLKPVTQQYVKRSDSKYALIDLYFPQISVCVEVDEDHHSKTKKNDDLRTEEILESLKTIGIDQIQTDKVLESLTKIEINKFYRISYTNDIEKLNKQINSCVNKINDEIHALTNSGKQLVWDMEENNKFILNKVKEKNKIHRDDNLVFNKDVDVFNKLFDLGYKPKARKAGKVLNDEYALNIVGIKVAGTAGRSKWDNILSKDLEILTEIKKDKDKPIDPKHYKRKRLIFGKYNSYGKGNQKIIFLGVYKPEIINDYQAKFTLIDKEFDFSLLK